MQIGWRRLLVGALVLALAIVLLQSVVQAPPHRIVIAADGPDGSFTRTAKSYTSRLAAQGVALDIVTTRGGVENLERMDAPGSKIDVAFVNGGLTSAIRSPDLESLGTVAYDPIWIVYRTELGELDAIPKLSGKRIGIGADGSGSQAIARAVLAACGVKEHLVATTPEQVLSDLTSGRIDASFVMGAPEETRIRALFTTDGVRVMNLADAEGLARNLTFLHALRVPRSTVDLARQKPEQDLNIVSSTVTLVARKEVHPALIYLLMSVVDEVHEPPSLLHKENEFPSDKDTDLPLSPQAEAYYRSGKPFLQRYLPFGLASFVERLLKVGIPVLVVVVPFLRFVPMINQWRVRRRLSHLYRRLLEIEQEKPEDAESRLGQLEKDLESERIPLLYAHERYVLREHIELARRHLER